MNELTKQNINDEYIEKINKKLLQKVISKIQASEQTLQEMEKSHFSEKAIYSKLYYHSNNFCSLYWEVQSEH